MTIKYYDQLDLCDTRVIIRVDFNVPFNSDGSISDDTRIKSSLSTIEYCLKEKAKVLLVSHLGRPKGEVVPNLSLRPVADHLSALLSKDVTFIDEPLEAAVDTVTNIASGEIALLENIRFYSGEEKNEDELGRQIAALGDIYINDAFATSHRAHASNVAVTEHIGSSAAGALLKSEIEYASHILDNPRRPLCAIIGGAKVSTKLDVLENILNTVDVLLIGGGMAFTFLKALGHEIGLSLLEEELIDTAQNIMDMAQNKNVKLLLPVDVIAAHDFDNDAEQHTVSVDSIPEDTIALDIGPETVALFAHEIKMAQTVVWNGPMGAFELANFSRGTFAIAESLALSQCTSIVGGGDSVTAVNQAGFQDQMSYISTGGGAFLELLEGKTLPGIAALDT